MSASLQGKHFFVGGRTIHKLMPTFPKDKRNHLLLPLATFSFVVVAAVAYKSVRKWRFGMCANHHVNTLTVLQTHRLTDSCQAEEWLVFTSKQNEIFNLWAWYIIHTIYAIIYSHTLCHNLKGGIYCILLTKHMAWRVWYTTAQMHLLTPRFEDCSVYSLL